jgi:hypothetical protein
MSGRLTIFRVSDYIADSLDEDRLVNRISEPRFRKYGTTQVSISTNTSARFDALGKIDGDRHELSDINAIRV